MAARLRVARTYHLNLIAWHTGEAESSFDDFTEAAHICTGAAGPNRLSQCHKGSRLSEPGVATPHHYPSRTLRLYLETRSPQAVARQMYVARNTVTYRLRQAEDLLGCNLTKHPLESLNALMITDAIDEELPAQPHQ